MKIRNLFYNSVTVSLPKNIAQFFLGFVLFWLIYGFPDMLLVATAFTGFILSYSSIYFFNDIFDCESDRRDREKKGWKLVANGVLTKEQAVVLGTAFLVSGLSLSAMVNGWFLMIILGLLLLNFLHSSPFIRLKKRTGVTAINITIIEFLKYSSCWFALTSDLTLYPFWIIMCFSIIYAVMYIVYKSGMRRKFIGENRYIIIPMSMGAAVSYIISFLVYDFTIPLMLLLFVSIALAMFGAVKKISLMRWLWVEFAVLPVLLVAFLLLSIPVVAQANDNLASEVDSYKKTVSEKFPDEVVDSLESLGSPPYESLEDVQEAINRTINLSNLGD